MDDSGAPATAHPQGGGPLSVRGSRCIHDPSGAIRIDAKRQALDALDVQRGRVLPVTGNGNGAEPDSGDAEIEAIIEVPDSVTSQSRHSLTLSGSPPSGNC